MKGDKPSAHRKFTHYLSEIPSSASGRGAAPHNHVASHALPQITALRLAPANTDSAMVSRAITVLHTLDTGRHCQTP
jgi:hypothetical protein